MELRWNEWIERAKGNDQDAFYQLYQNSYDAVYRTVKSMIRDDDMVMDIVQDAFVKGFSNLSALDNPCSFVPWMRRIAANKAKDWFKKKQEIAFSQLADEDGNEPDFEDERTENMPEEVIDRNETARLIDEILNGLSDEQRIAVGMFYYQNMSVAEIAKELAVSENTVKSRLNYGRKKIKISVEELEKKGIKLYSLSPVAFLVFLFRNQIAQAVVGGAPEAAFGAIMANTSAAIAGAAAGTAAGAGTAAAANAASVGTGTFAGAEATTAAGAAKTGFLASMGAKITAGVLAAAIVSGSVAAGVYFSRDKSQKLPDLTDPIITFTTTPSVENPDPDSDPDTETESNLNFVVLSEEYEELYSIAVAEVADHRVVAAKKDGKWGVIDETGKVIIPFEYAAISSPSASGHMLATHEDADTKKKTYTVFDAKGNDILTTDKYVEVGTDVMIIYEKSYEEDDSYITFYRIEVKRISTGETLLKEEYAFSFSCCSFEDCFVVLAAKNPETGEGQESVTFYNSKGEILSRQELSGGWMDSITELQVTTTWGGYYMSKHLVSTGVSIATLDGSEEYYYAWDVGYEYRDKVGALLLLYNDSSVDPSGDGKYYLLDLRTLPGDYEIDDIPNYLLTTKGYDYISINALESWFRVNDESKQGFLSRDGKRERLYDGAGDFVRGKAIVMDGGEVYVVDDSLTVISDKLSDGFTAVKTLGEGLYGVMKDGKWYLAVYIE